MDQDWAATYALARDGEIIELVIKKSERYVIAVGRFGEIPAPIEGNWVSGGLAARHVGEAGRVVIYFGGNGIARLNPGDWVICNARCSPCISSQGGEVEVEYCFIECRTFDFEFLVHRAANPMKGWAIHSALGNVGQHRIA